MSFTHPMCYAYAMAGKVVLVLLALSLLANGIFAFRAWEGTRVVSVPDGDSLDLADGRRIRLLGIDAPERGRCMADEARDKLIDLALGRHVRLKERVTDDYGRTLAIVLVNDIATTNDRLIQRALVSQGLARNRSSVSNPYHQVLKDAQEVAKSGKLGIWGDACRGKEPKGDCAIKGNIRESKKFYYLPSCKQYEQVIVDTSFGDRWFCSEAEATGAGFTPACRPL